MGEGKFFNANHLLVIWEERRDIQKIRDDVNDAKLKTLVAELDSYNQNLIICTKNIGAWLNVLVNTVTSTVLVDTEFCDFVCACYDVTPTKPQRKYNGCATFFGVRHILSFRKELLIIEHCNKVRDKLLYLARRAFPSTCLCGKLLTHQSRSMSEGEIHQGGDRLETKGGVLIL